ncbi:hypothetical protein KSP39_PZI022565 [Platanthera zijinensis]|uniref:Mitochondrial ATPase complex subunit ATP10 n=1 Tax=Platanthera zijinensis TaxID=2320716 RepID=A0AAP0FUH5_9ASPA
MLRRLLQPASTSAASLALLVQQKIIFSASAGMESLRRDRHYQILFRRHFIDLHKMVDKEAIKKEKARLKDELSRGYFADIAEIRENSGKIAPANETLIPLTEAVKFPGLVVYNSDGSCLDLPLSEQNTREGANAKHESWRDTLEKKGFSVVSDVCLCFMDVSHFVQVGIFTMEEQNNDDDVMFNDEQRMTESWSTPFLDAFDASSNVQVYEVSLIDSWLLSLSPVKNIFLKIAKSSSDPRRRFVYSFGDHYDFRKKLQILNLLTGYIFLLDGHSRIRWQGFGSATPEELSYLVSSTSLLLEQK